MARPSLSHLPRTRQEEGRVLPQEEGDKGARLSVDHVPYELTE